MFLYRNQQIQLSQNYLLVCADLQGLSPLQRGISTPNKVLTMRNFIPQQGNLKLVGFVARAPMRSTDQVRHMLSPSPVICHTLKHFTWAVGEQGTPKCICNSALGPVAEAHLHHAYRREQLSQPVPGTLPDTSSSPTGKCAGPEWHCLPQNTLCSLPAPCSAFNISCSCEGARTNGKGKASACKCSERSMIWCALQIAKENMTVQTKEFMRGCKQWWS